MDDETWPALPYEAWKDTYATLHMWTQVVGKVALALMPPLNHSWAIAMQVTPRGLSTRTLPYGDRFFSIQFDFIDHQLVIRASDDETRTLPLRPQTVAEFYRDVMAALDAMGLSVKIWPMPVGGALANPVRPGHRASRVRSGVREPLLADSPPGGACVRRVAVRVRRQVQPRPFLLGRLRPGSDPLLRQARAAPGGAGVHA